tara:strand:- start:242 stop:568 length:327 start_codon:yes stop_codon:yes gene_type:complete
MQMMQITGVLMEIHNLYFDGCKVKCSSILLGGGGTWINVVNCDLTQIVGFLTDNTKSGSGFNVGIDTCSGYYESLCFVGMVNEKGKSFTLCLSGKINKASNEYTNKKD